jgi:hypothetical protein
MKGPPRPGCLDLTGILKEIDTVYTRDGSYGLLRRPIRYNMLLIRNTRIIRKRIMLFWGVPWACTNHPPTTTNCPPSLQNIIMPLGKDPEWHCVVVMGQKGQIYKMPDARILRVQQRCPLHLQALYEAESQRRCSSMQS